MDSHSDNHNHHSAEKGGYTPLIIILSVITLSAFIITLTNYNTFDISFLKAFLNYFMVGYLLTFATVKLLDLRGFVEGYRTYDILAKKSVLYAYLYPFCELILGLLYIVFVNSIYLNIFTIVLFGFSNIGVIQEITKKSGIHCSCLGTILNVPLSWVTVAENTAMVLMAMIHILV